jgi:hypothetical protein
MDVGLLFAILMILWGLSIIGGWLGANNPWLLGTSAVLEWILFALLGYKVFGPLIH